MAMEQNGLVHTETTHPHPIHDAQMMAAVEQNGPALEYTSADLKAPPRRRGHGQRYG